MINLKKINQQGFNSNYLQPKVICLLVICKSKKNEITGIYILKSVFSLGSFIFFFIKLLNFFVYPNSGSTNNLGKVQQKSFEQPVYSKVKSDSVLTSDKPLPLDNIRLNNAKNIILNTPTLEYLSKINLQGEVVVTILKDNRFIFETADAIFPEKVVGDFTKTSFTYLHPQIKCLGIWRDLHIFCSEVPGLQNKLPCMTDLKTIDHHVLTHLDELEQLLYISRIETTPLKIKLESTSDGNSLFNANISKEISYKCLTIDTKLGLFYDKAVNLPLTTTLLWKQGNNIQPYIKLQGTPIIDLKNNLTISVDIDPNSSVGFKKNIIDRYFFGAGMTRTRNSYVEFGYNNKQGFCVKSNISGKGGLRFLIQGDLNQTSNIFRSQNEACLTVNKHVPEKTVSLQKTVVASKTKSRPPYGSLVASLKEQQAQGQNQAQKGSEVPKNASSLADPPKPSDKIKGLEVGSPTTKLATPHEPRFAKNRAKGLRGRSWCDPQQREADQKWAEQRSQIKQKPSGLLVEKKSIVLGAFTLASAGLMIAKNAKIKNYSKLFTALFTSGTLLTVVESNISDKTKEQKDQKDQKLAKAYLEQSTELSNVQTENALLQEQLKQSQELLKQSQDKIYATVEKNVITEVTESLWYAAILAGVSGFAAFASCFSLFLEISKEEQNKFFVNENNLLSDEGPDPSDWRNFSLGPTPPFPGDQFCSSCFDLQDLPDMLANVKAQDLYNQLRKIPYTPSPPKLMINIPFKSIGVFYR